MRSVGHLTTRAPLCGAQEDCHWLPVQAYTRGADGCSTVLHYETLDDEFTELAQGAGGALATLPSLSSIHDLHVPREKCSLNHTLLSNEVRSALASVYAEDMAAFGYSSDPGTPPSRRLVEVREEAEYQEEAADQETTVQDATAVSPVMPKDDVLYLSSSRGRWDPYVTRTSPSSA